MASRSILRPRQTSTATVVSQTPTKETMNETVAGRRSLPRSAKIQVEREGYRSQLYSPEKRHEVKKKSNEMTPASKISHKFASSLTIDSPASHGRSYRSLSRTRRSSAHRSLSFSSKPLKKTQCEPPFESIEIENDENIPPVGDTVGRRLSKRTSKPISSAFQSSERTPLKMKITKSNNTARISSYTVKYRSPSIKEYKCVRAPDDAKILP
ncbi:hypothetical protein KIN20_004633, partial [Parelaphostrongylus tenuis]